VEVDDAVAAFEASRGEGAATTNPR
jgi:hypothetical protein